jgi:hypothetical protein
MASVMEEIRKSRKVKTKPNQTRSLKNGPACPELTGDEPNQDRLVLGTSHRRVTQEEWDSGPRSVSHTGQSELTEKLCQRMMVLIWWKVGADIAVMEHVVWVLEEWLHRRGISIYTDLL